MYMYMYMYNYFTELSEAQQGLIKSNGSIHVHVQYIVSEFACEMYMYMYNEAQKSNCGIFSKLYPLPLKLD